MTIPQRSLQSPASSPAATPASSADAPELLCEINGRKLFVQPCSVNGMAIVCKVPATEHRLAGTMVLHSYSAIDQSRFWSLWRALGGDRQGLVWENGEPVCGPEPSGQKPTLRVVAMPGRTTRWGRVWRAALALWRAFLEAIFASGGER